MKENGYSFLIDWQEGQKTGFFLDQRENRAFLSTIAAGKKVLNAFCYSGAFTVYGLGGGAQYVCSVDSSKTAIAQLNGNVARNFSAANHEAIVADYFSYMRELPEDFDVIVLDPPAFAKHRGAIKGALAGYQGINANAIGRIKPGGLVFTFSCSQLVSRQMFFEVLNEAALKVDRRVSVVKELHQAPCHPINLYHPEGDYLKGFVLSVN